MAEPMLRIEAPKRFGGRQILMTHLFSAAAVSITVSFLGFVVILYFWTLRHGNLALFWSFPQLMTPLGVMVLYFSVMPFLSANPYIRYLLNREFATRVNNSTCYDCQITLYPRLCTGFRAFIEDADDIGRLEITRDALVFTGDHVHLHLPIDSIASALPITCGSRRMWIFGDRLRITTDAFVGVTRFDFFERQSNTLAESHRVGREMYRTLS